ncbi:MAG: hypothetical protein WCT01_01350 [Candidatus Shapirobacteria bacterium]
MDFYTLKFIITFISVLWFAGLTFGLPIEFWLNNKKGKSSLGWCQVFGVSIIIVIINVLYYFGFNNINKNTIIVIVGLMWLVNMYILSKTNFEVIKKLAIKEITLWLMLIIISLAFLLPQKRLPFSVPSYRVNHDAIGILVLSKTIEKKGNIGNYCLSNRGYSSCKIVSTGYPVGYPLLLSYIKPFFLQDYYELTHLLAVYLYSLTLVPLYFISCYFFKKRSYSLVVALLSLLSFLSIQYVNQSFYSQTSLTFLLFSALYFLMLIAKRKHVDVQLLVLISLLISGGIYIYSLTIFLWLIPLYILLIIFNTNNYINCYKVKIIQITLIGLLVMLFSAPYISNTLRLFYNSIFNYKGTEISFFQAKGNTIGYPSFLTSTSSWLDLDFRLNNPGRLAKYSLILFVFQLILVCFSLVKFAMFRNKYISSFVGFIFTIIFTLIISRFYLKSPYYYGKTLFFSSLFFNGLIWIVILENILRKKKNVFIFFLSMFVLLFMVNNSIKSVNYISSLPEQKVQMFRNIENLLVKNNVNKVVAIDDEDWLEYFLTDFGSCVTFSNSHPCGGENLVVLSQNNITVVSGGYYLIGNKFKDKTLNINDAEVIFKTEEFNLYKF